MGGVRSSSLSGSNDGSLKLPILSYILVLIDVYMYVVVGLSVSTDDGLNLTTVDKVYRVNTTLGLNCSLNDSSQSDNATDIMWTFNGEVLNETTSQLVIENAQFEDSGIYGCKVDGLSQEQDIRWNVKVGLPPTKATDISCVSYDFNSLNCSWQNGRFTNIETTHVFQFSHRRTIGYKYKCQMNQKCQVDELTGDLYFVRVNSSNALGIQSESEEITVKKFMIITPIRSPNVTNSTSTSLQVSWRPSKEYSIYPTGKKDLTYVVTYKLENTLQWNPTDMKEYKNKCQECSFIIHGLKANSLYTIGITVKITMPFLQSKEITLQGRTKEIAPEAGVNLQLLCPRIEGTNEARLSWTPFPEEKSNGKILSYDIQVTQNENSSDVTKDPNITEHRLQDVDLYSDYNVTIVARNSAGSSDKDRCYIPALPRADPSTVVLTVLIIVGAALVIIVFILGFKFYICFKKSKITEIKLPHHIQHDNFYLFGGPQRRAPCEQERYDELITKSLVEKDPTLSIPNGKTDSSREPIMPESVKTEVPTT